MKKIYCISGLSADEKMFARLELPGYEFVHINWIIPTNGESIVDYASRMAAGIDDPNPILLGLSFGGMVSIEIAIQKNVEKIILISSIKSREELPRWMRMAGRLKLNKIFPLRSNRLTEPLQNRNLGVESKEEKALAKEYRKNVDRKYLLWAIDAILNWKPGMCTAPIFHIHGDKDRLFPLKSLKPNFVVPAGGHFMILNRADIISNKIKEILKESQC